MDERFNNLKVLLDQQNYPSVYLFKFIIKKDEEKLVAIKRCFDESAEIELIPSKNGNFVSLRIKEMMLNSETILMRYKEVGKIKNVMTL